MIRIGQIGVGSWGRNLLRNFDGLRDSQVVMACDANPDVLVGIGQNFPAIRTTAVPDEVISDPEVDAVVIATLPVTHYALAAQALEAGKDVFVEKPMVLAVADGERLVRLAEERGRILMVGHLMEYHSALLQLKDYVDQGDLGDLYYLYSERVNLGKVRKDENALWSLAPHDVSMVLFLMGKEPVRVTAVGQSYLQDGVPDVAFAILHFEGGAMAHIHVSWLDPHKIRKLTLVGSRKMAVFDDMATGESIRVYDKGVEQSGDYSTYGESLSLRWGDVLIPRIAMTEPLRAECEHFVASVQTRIPPRSDGRDGLRVLRVLDACQRSMDRQGAPVSLE
ncbi:MAG: Gfo/Idh/MocA family oxidoreductase [Candidatus Latescibacterota bacterium]